MNKISSSVEGLYHRVGRVLSFFSSRRNWDSPTPLAAGECAPPPFGPGGGNTRLQQKGWGSHNSEEVTYTVVLYVYKYFVDYTIHRVPQCLFPPRPPPQANEAPPYRTQVGGGNTLACVGGGGGPNSDEGTESRYPIYSIL
jgi:hypothetical protein